MQIVLLTPETEMPHETGIVNSLFAAGLQRLHLRRYGATEAQIIQYISAIHPQFHPRIVVHSHYHLLHDLHLYGIHLNTATRLSPAVSAMTSGIPAEKTSTSFHSWLEVIDNTVPYRYVFISPVFNSISKPGYLAGIDRTQLPAIRAQQKASGSAPAIYALGGIDHSNIITLKNDGFDGAALLGSIWQAQDPVRALTNILELLK
ncbi:MAG: thiamine phosphate synthase [Chitinophagaceae bacterium]|nr:thiamine phosphate synthase [Chitinophagaceae bacterium]